MRFISNIQNRLEDAYEVNYQSILDNPPILPQAVYDFMPPDAPGNESKNMFK